MEMHHRNVHTRALCCRLRLNTGISSVVQWECCTVCLFNDAVNY